MAVSLISPFHMYGSRFVVSADYLITFCFFFCMSHPYIFLLADYNLATVGFGRTELNQVQHLQRTAVKKKGSLSFSW